MLAQLNRQAEGEKPRLSHLRDSGCLEQDADVVLLLDRDRNDAAGKTALTIAKNRDGVGGVVVPLSFDAEHTRFDPAGNAYFASSAKHGASAHTQQQQQTAQPPENQSEKRTTTLAQQEF
jgi:hypothetical protein